MAWILEREVSWKPPRSEPRRSTCRGRGEGRGGQGHQDEVGWVGWWSGAGAPRNSECGRNTAFLHVIASSHHHRIPPQQAHLVALHGHAVEVALARRPRRNVQVAAHQRLAKHLPGKMEVVHSSGGLLLLCRYTPGGAGVEAHQSAAAAAQRAPSIQPTCRKAGSNLGSYFKRLSSGTTSLPYCRHMCELAVERDGAQQRAGAPRRVGCAAGHSAHCCCFPLLSNPSTITTAWGLLQHDQSLSSRRTCSGYLTSCGLRRLRGMKETRPHLPRLSSDVRRSAVSSSSTWHKIRGEQGDLSLNATELACGAL